MKQKILIVDDEVSILQSLSGILEDEGYEVILASSGEQGLEKAKKDPPDLIVLDIWMPGVDGITVLDEIKKLYPLIPVMIISGHGSIETAVKATRMGAFDFIEKPLSIERVLVSIQNAIEFSRLEEENRLLRKKSDRSIIGESAAVTNLRDQIGRAAPTNATVLITGENGTGKELAHGVAFLGGQVLDGLLQRLGKFDGQRAHGLLRIRLRNSRGSSAATPSCSEP